MVDVTPKTQHFNLTRVGAGESISKDGWAFTDLDRVKLDDLLYALLLHKHTGEPALGDPTDPPTFTAVSTGGHLAAATTYYYRVSFVDQWGLESAASPEGSVTTPNPIPAPSAPAATVESASGTVQPGVYSYLITVTDAFGGETVPSAANNVQVESGTTNRIRLDLPALPAGGTQFRVYRSRPGQTQFYFLTSSAGTSVYDQGDAEDQTVLAPTQNTTNSANSVQVTIPLNFIPLGCTGWRIYRATESGAYDGNSLVHEVVEGLTDTSTTPRTMWVDTGDSLLAGTPQESSSTIPQGSLLSLNDLAGTLPLAAIPRGVRCMSFYQAGTGIADGETLFITNSPAPIKPVRLTAFFKTPPPAGTSVTLHFQDSEATPQSIDLLCDDSGGSPAGYFHKEWPVSEAYLAYAESGTVSDPASVQIVTDQLSPSGQSVVLATESDWVQISLGVLDVGLYAVLASMRANSSTSAAGDVQFDIIRLDTNASIHTTTATVTSTGFADVAAGSFTAPGAVEMALRITKATSAVQSYQVASGRYTTSVPELAAGLVTVTAILTGATGGGVAAGDVNVALWF